jgi:hypothetical protein
MTLNPDQSIFQEKIKAGQNYDIVLLEAVEAFCKSCPFWKGCSIACDVEKVLSRCSFGIRHFRGIAPDTLVPMNL